MRFSRLLFRRPYCLPPLANRIFSAGPCIVYPFSRLLFHRPYLLPFSANKIFSPAPLSFHRPYCLPLSTNRIFSAGPCNVCTFSHGYCSVALIVYPSRPIESFRRDRVLAMRLSRLLFSRLFCSVEICSENRFNVTKISKRAVELIAFFFILLRATKDVARIKSCSNKRDIGNEPGTTKIFQLARRLITGWRTWLPSTWCCELNVVGI